MRISSKRSALGSIRRTALFLSPLRITQAMQANEGGCARAGARSAASADVDEAGTGTVAVEKSRSFDVVAAGL
jgi:hypothetical protein